MATKDLVEEFDRDPKNITETMGTEDIKNLQTFLVQNGYDIGKKGIDGWYGPKTTQAVKKYQQDAGLKVDGIVGKKTIASIQGSDLGSEAAVGVGVNAEKENSSSPVSDIDAEITELKARKDSISNTRKNKIGLFTKPTSRDEQMLSKRISDKHREKKESEDATRKKELGTPTKSADAKVATPAKKEVVQKTIDPKKAKGLQRVSNVEREYQKNNKALKEMWNNTTWFGQAKYDKAEEAKLRKKVGIQRAALKQIMQEEKISEAEYKAYLKSVKK